MALVTSLEKRDPQRVSVHSEVRGTLAVFEKDGTKIVQIDTYGRPDRAIPGKVSQTLQFNEESAKQLLAVLKREFGE
jgi:hypothetical protein